MASGFNSDRANRQVAAVKAKLAKRIDQVKQGLVLEAYRRLVLRTPVDYGRARANWHVSNGTPSREVADLPEMRGKRGSRGRAAAAATAGLERARGVVTSVTAKEVTFIVNNVHYIIFLERGSSKQAPNGMVTVTIAELKQLFPQLVRQVRQNTR